MHTFFFLFRILILKLLYLYNFRSPMSRIKSCSSHMSPLSNIARLIKIGFSKEELCPISHDDLIIDSFSRANLYKVPHVTVLNFCPKYATQKTIVHPIYITTYEIWSQCLEKKLWRFSQCHMFDMEFGSLQKP